MMACSRAAADADATVDLLLSKGADVAAKSTGGQTALHLCASKANLACTRTLLARGASARTRDKRGMLALHRAAAVGCVPVLRALVGEGKSPLNASDVDGMTALHHAVSEGHGDAALVLLLAGAEWDRKDKEGRVALDYVPDAKTRAFILQAAEREGIELE
jgi:26S proteasome non-ATPase regulatory subunit 10